MRKELEILIEMQKRDDEISKLQVLIENLPKQLSNLKKNVATAESGLKTVKEEIENNKKEEDKLELEIRSNKDMMGKYQNQLLTIQTNKEYKALNKEVSHLEKKNEDLEDEIVELMEDQEDLRVNQQGFEDDLKSAKQELAENEQRLENEIKEVNKDMEVIRSERKELAKELPMPIVKKYATLIKNRHRKALVYNIGNTCGGCGFMIRPQVMVELHEGEKILFCESCSRIIVLNKED
ncbi:MAG: C4-type zinc ribbon domain-containing protein [Candidatus Stygibacter frigidus]|nr:C4-type zinc ribbon domain-containing protein [Candidatus Stygibacter frigidus]